MCPLKAETDLKRGGRGAPASLFFATTFFLQLLCRLEIVLFEDVLIISNAHLKYVYPSTKETCLSPNHLLFGRQLLYSCNTTSTVAPNLIILSSTTDEINYISNHLWDRSRYEYVVNLRQTQWISKLNIKRWKAAQRLLENCH